MQQYRKLSARSNKSYYKIAKEMQQSNMWASYVVQLYCDVDLKISRHHSKLKALRPTASFQSEGRVRIQFDVRPSQCCCSIAPLNY